ncbi:hypothetical protein L2E82_20832 [Cichorium intybus]|uniref:Uncharacterized protein n=1 Tax=Cichorium intybus TaxID=13427 RepID=A0ACB9DU38_CICIN|nr:hypothetical protein L2E82_20832 [Cichorium intybus]
MSPLIACVAAKSVASKDQISCSDPYPKKAFIASGDQNNKRSLKKPFYAYNFSGSNSRLLHSFVLYFKLQTFSFLRLNLCGSVKASSMNLDYLNIP